MWMAESHDAAVDALLSRDPADIAAILRRSSTEGWTTYFIRELLDILGVRLTVYAPFDLLQPNPMSDEYGEVLGELLVQISTCGAESEVLFAPHVSQKRDIQFSFHSHGKSPNVWHLKDSHVPGRFYFNQEGYSGWLSLSRKNLEYLDSHEAFTEGLNFARDYIERNASKYEQPHRIDHGSLTAPFVFMPLQILNDTVAVHHRINMLEAIDIAAESVAATKRRLVVKRHPLCRDARVESKLSEGAARGAITLFDGSVHDAIAHSDVVLTANSSVGFTALLHLKPVITFGASDYESCTFSVSTPAELIEMLGRPDLRADEGRIARYLRLYLEQLTFEIADSGAVRRRVIEAIATYIEQGSVSAFRRRARARLRSSKVARASPRGEK
jgi:hypothetical protein